MERSDAPDPGRDFCQQPKSKATSQCIPAGSTLMAGHELEAESVDDLDAFAAFR